MLPESHKLYARRLTLLYAGRLICGLGVFQAAIGLYDHRDWLFITSCGIVQIAVGLLLFAKRHSLKR